MVKRSRKQKTEAWFSLGADAVKTIKELEAKVEELTEERDNARRETEERFQMGQTLVKQLVQAENRIEELLAEIKTYEHEHSTLRNIIIDALRGGR